MADHSILNSPTFYAEDLKTVSPGTVLVSQPCILWTIIAALETTGVAVINVSDDNNGYNPAHRVGKIVINGPTTDWNGFGKGMNFNRGVSVQSNLAGVDMWGVYE